MERVLFISKSIEEKAFLRFCKKMKVELISKPMIRFEKITCIAPKNKDYDAVFFTSKRSVDFFLATEKEAVQSKFLACIGKSTANALAKHGLIADFIGEKSGNPNAIAQQFKKEIGTKKVLFPQSDRSQRSIQKALVHSQYIDLVVYKTILTPFVLHKKPDIVVFTSPSNAEAYLQKHTLDHTQHVIAWGTTTQYFLEQQHVKVDSTLSESSLEELEEVVTALSGV